MSVPLAEQEVLICFEVRIAFCHGKQAERAELQFPLYL